LLLQGSLLLSLETRVEQDGSKLPTQSGSKRPHSKEAELAAAASGSLVTHVAIGDPRSAGFPAGDTDQKVGATKGHDHDN
jgi:hypothetical protein